MEHTETSNFYTIQDILSLDGHNDARLKADPAWKGAVASRIRSLNELNRPAEKSIAMPTRSIPHLREAHLREESKPDPPKPILDRAPPYTPPADDSNAAPAERVNPFVRRSPSAIPSPPGLPRRTSHSEVPVHSPRPHVLVKRPSFFEDQTSHPSHPSVSTYYSSPKPELNFRQGCGHQPPGNFSPAASAPIPTLSPTRGTAVQDFSPSPEHSTMRHVEPFSSKNRARIDRLERDDKGVVDAVGQRQEAQTNAASSWSVTSRKSQPELSTKKSPAEVNPTLTADMRQGLAVQGPSSPMSARTTSPSIAIGPRRTTFGRAGRIRSLSDEFVRPKQTSPFPRAGIVPGTLLVATEEIAPPFSPVAGDGSDINLPARLFSPQPLSYNEVQYQNPRIQESPGLTHKRRQTTPSNHSTHHGMATAPPNAIHSIDAILSEHAGVLSNVIEQLQKCSPRLERIRSLSQEFVPSHLKSSATRDEVPSEPRDRPRTMKALDEEVCHMPSPPNVENSPEMQRKRTRSITDLVHLINDAAQDFGLNMKKDEQEEPRNMAEELPRPSGEIHEVEGAETASDFSAPSEELHKAFSKPVASLPAKLPVKGPQPMKASSQNNSSHFNHNTVATTAVSGERTKTPSYRQYFSTPPPSPPILDGPRRAMSFYKFHTTLPIPASLPHPHSPRTKQPSSPRAESKSTRPIGPKRVPSSYLSAKGTYRYTSTTISPMKESPSTLSIQPTPEIYFPYQHVRAPTTTTSSLDNEGKLEPSIPPETARDSYYPRSSDMQEERKDAIIQAPDTPPPPPPLFLILPPNSPLLMPGSFISPAVSPGLPMKPDLDLPKQDPPKELAARSAAGLAQGEKRDAHPAARRILFQTPSRWSTPTPLPSSESSYLLSRTPSPEPEPFKPLPLRRKPKVQDEQPPSQALRRDSPLLVHADIAPAKPDSCHSSPLEPNHFAPSNHQDDGSGSGYQQARARPRSSTSPSPNPCPRARPPLKRQPLHLSASSATVPTFPQALEPFTDPNAHPVDHRACAHYHRNSSPSPVNLGVQDRIRRLEEARRAKMAQSAEGEGGRWSGGAKEQIRALRWPFW